MTFGVFGSKILFGDKDMRVDLTTKDIIDIFSSNERVGMGSHGIVFKYDDDTLFKFKYKEFIDCFPVVDGAFDFSSIADIGEEIKTRKYVQGIISKGEEPRVDREIKGLMSKQKWLRKNTLPQGMVYVDGYCVGYLLKHHKDMVNLYDYLQDHTLPAERVHQVVCQVGDSVRELIGSAIYHDDFTARNIMYNVDTGATEIIDFEDCVRSYDVINHRAGESFMRDVNRFNRYLMSRVDTPTM